MSNATQPAALFPGQGSHTPEMRDLVTRRAPELLEKVSELVGEDPFARVEENTRFAQPAIFCAWVSVTKLTQRTLGCRHATSVSSHAPTPHLGGRSGVDGG